MRDRKNIKKCVFYLRIRLTFAFVANEITNEIDNSKAAHSMDNDHNLAVLSLRKRLVSRLGVTDRNHFDFHSNFFNFSNLQYSVSVYLSVRRQNLLSKSTTTKEFVYFDLVSLQKS